MSICSQEETVRGNLLGGNCKSPCCECSACMDRQMDKHVSSNSFISASSLTRRQERGFKNSWWALVPLAVPLRWDLWGKVLVLSRHRKAYIYLFCIKIINKMIFPKQTFGHRLFSEAITLSSTFQFCGVCDLWSFSHQGSDKNVLLFKFF